MWLLYYSLSSLSKFKLTEGESDIVNIIPPPKSRRRPACVSVYSIFILINIDLMSYVWMLLPIKNDICISLAQPRNKEYIAARKLNDLHVTEYCIF